MLQSDYINIFSKFKGEKGDLIPILQLIQRKLGFISENATRNISRFLKISENQIFGVATFYSQFRFTESGRNSVKVCLGTACHLNGAVQNLEQVQRALSIRAGETTEDRMFSLETVNCVGTCALAPVTMVDEDYYGAVTPGKVEKILSTYSTGSGSAENGED